MKKKSIERELTFTLLPKGQRNYSGVFYKDLDDEDRKRARQKKLCNCDEKK